MGTMASSIGRRGLSHRRLALRRQRQLPRRQREPAQEQVPNNNGQRLITKSQVAAGELSLPPFFATALGVP
jgi:hypothetical protein